MNINRAYQGLIYGTMTYGFETFTRNAIRKRFITSSPIVIDSTPLITVRKTAWKSALREWEWFMSGSDNIKDLHESVRKWWSPWADTNGRVRFNYGYQFRFWENYLDQIEWLIDNIIKHPMSTRNIISTWNLSDMIHDECRITNCHGTMIQCFVDGNNALHLKTYQRSVDTICGLPHNWIQYWAFLMWLSHRTGKKVGNLIWIGGDVHIYEQHYEIAKKMMEIIPSFPPELIYTPVGTEFKAENFSLDREYEYTLNETVEMVV